MSTRINHAETVALRKVGNPQGFSVCGWTVLDDGSVLFQMKQEMPRDPGKRRKWTGPTKTASVSRQEHEAEANRHEAETGRCAECDGSKQEWSGWSATEGDRFRPCRRCNATGKAVQ